MTNQQLVDYIKNAIKQGYKVGDLEIYLIEKGWSPAAVKEAVALATKKRFPSAIIGIFILLAGVGFSVFFLLPKGTVMPASVSIGLPSQVLPGSTLDTVLSIQTTGRAKDNLMLTYSITPADKFGIVSRWDDLISPPYPATYTKSIDVPSTAASQQYTLDIRYMYKDQSSTLTKVFTVGQSQTPTPLAPTTPTIETPGVVSTSCPASCDDMNSCTYDYCDEQTRYLCSYDPVSNCCGNSVCETTENESSCPQDARGASEEAKISRVDELEDIIWRAKNLTAENPQSGFEYCRNQENPVNKDECYLAMADATNETITCENIIDSDKKDLCWTKINNCEQVVNGMVKRSCELLNWRGSAGSAIETRESADTTPA